MVKKDDLPDANIPARISFPEDEEAHDWISILFESYFITDQGVASAILKEEEKGRKLACEKGCAACCRTHIRVPVYPIELSGLSWYATEKVRGPTRERLKEQLKDFRERVVCPFLVDDFCSVYPVRPMGCRWFNVFGEACNEGEDAYYTRREDVMEPEKGSMDKAMNITLPHYGFTNRAARRKVMKDDEVHTLARSMLNHNWATLAEKMDDYEKKHPYLK